MVWLSEKIWLRGAYFRRPEAIFRRTRRATP